jgi:hypothetical protein
VRIVDTGGVFLIHGRFTLAALFLLAMLGFTYIGTRIISASQDLDASSSLFEQDHREQD